MPSNTVIQICDRISEDHESDTGNEAMVGKGGGRKVAEQGRKLIQQLAKKMKHYIEKS